MVDTPDPAQALLQTAAQGELPVEDRCPFEITGQELIESNRRPSGPRGTGFKRLSRLRARAGSRHGFDPRPDRFGQAFRIIGQPDQQSRVAQYRRP